MVGLSITIPFFSPNTLCIPWTVRPQVLLLSNPLSVVLSAAIPLAYHPVRVCLVDGKWCARFYPDGTEKILYGEECSGFAPHSDR
ncbi:hypothetical protein H6F89_05740 [Cyanobacteria bacterium FACHB-63]|nr:hypothetical protein [Cyanobacteria bacterium FACHB-63]